MNARGEFETRPTAHATLAQLRQQLLGAGHRLDAALELGHDELVELGHQDLRACPVRSRNFSSRAPLM